MNVYKRLYFPSMPSTNIGQYLWMFDDCQASMPALYEAFSDASNGNYKVSYTPNDISSSDIDQTKIYNGNKITLTLSDNISIEVLTNYSPNLSGRRFVGLLTMYHIGSIDTWTFVDYNRGNTVGGYYRSIWSSGDTTMFGNSDLYTNPTFIIYKSKNIAEGSKSDDETTSLLIMSQSPNRAYNSMYTDIANPTWDNSIDYHFNTSYSGNYDYIGLSNLIYQNSNYASKTLKGVAAAPRQYFGDILIGGVKYFAWGSFCAPYNG